MGRVAPHAGAEVRLVLAGLKPMATVERGKDESQYALAISLGSTGMLHTVVRPTEDDPEGEVAFTKPHNRACLQTYQDLLSHGVSRYGIKDYHRRMGKLFGYSEPDIEAFISAEIQCDCTKCKGT